MAFVIRCLGRIGETYNPDAGDMTGLLLQEFDPEYRGGRGMALWTEDVAKALRFDSALEAWSLWRTQSITMPRRPDGRPNRPLTAYTIEALQEEEL